MKSSWVWKGDVREIGLKERSENWERIWTSKTVRAKRQKTIIFSNQGLMKRKEKTMMKIWWKWDKRKDAEAEEEEEQEDKKDFEERAFGERREKTLKLQENVFWALSKTWKKLKSKPPKTKWMGKIHLFCKLKDNPLFWKISVFFNLHPFFTKVVFCWKHSK